MQILFDAAANTLRFVLAETTSARAPADVAAVLDIGERGRLLALTVTLADGRDVDLVLGDDEGGASRSAPARVTAHLDASGDPVAIDLPRRGAGYEITYPSGNQ
jgi:hypothetical protein